ncbi:MAG: MXAN_6640 family putative metalloprotease [Solirubrobacterales bacterium]
MRARLRLRARPRPFSARLLCASLALLSAFAALPSGADAGDQWTFRQPLARPTDRPNPTRLAYAVPEAPRSPACAGHFCVHWVAEGIDAPADADANGSADGDGVPDYVERVLAIGAHVRRVENGELGWREPRSDGRRGGRRGKTDVYLKELGKLLFGYASPDEGQTPKGDLLPRRLYGYLVLDNDYGRSQYPTSKPRAALAVTFAHEYCHILQMGYDAYQDPWMAESTAVWMEDQVYDGIDDYLQYVRRWVRLYRTPLTANSIREYGSAVWNDWLTERYGDTILRNVWARALHTKPGGFSVSSYDSAIRAAGRSELSRDLARFARDVAEWRTGGRFHEGRRYPDVPRQGSLPRNGRPLQRTLNHATFQLLRVHARGAHAVVARAVAPQGVAAGLALVGRTGGERSGRVVSKLRFRRGGGRMTVRLGRPGRFRRITAVVINADTRAEGFDARRLDWNYLTETAPFRVLARAVR